MLIKYSLSNYCLAVTFYKTLKDQLTTLVAAKEEKSNSNSGRIFNFWRRIQTQVQGDLQIFRGEFKLKFKENYQKETC